LVKEKQGGWEVMDDIIKEKQKHESYGMLQFSRVQGGDTALFGSSIMHNNTIRLRLCEGSVSRGLNTDWYSAGKEYFEVEMSQTQFAECISSMNCGSGVPVTIRRINGKRTENCPFENKRMIFEKEFEAKMQALAKRLTATVEDVNKRLSDKKPLTIKEREGIQNRISNFCTEIYSNIPFVNSQFNEQMDKTVNEAKGEIDAFVLNKVTSLGLEKLEELKQLGGGKID
jgi:hypothetical protein